MVLLLLSAHLHNLNLFGVVQYIFMSLFLQITVVEEGDLIAKRTRSQLPLQDVSIESIEGTYCINTTKNKKC